MTVEWGPDTFAGADSSDCSGCIGTCEADATEAEDAEVLTCLATAQGSAECGAGIEGAFPFIDAVNGCCDGRSDSPYCMELCRIILTNDVASGLFTTCGALYP